MTMMTKKRGFGPLHMRKIGYERQERRSIYSDRRMASCYYTIPLLSLMVFTVKGTQCLDIDTFGFTPPQLHSLKIPPFFG